MQEKQNKNWKIKKYKAVSLLELMTVIAIIAIMTGMGIVSFQGSRTTSKLQAAQREVASTIKLAQSYALEGRTQAGGAGLPAAPCGYGVRFNTNTQYVIYYNLKPGGTTCEARHLNANFRRYINNIWSRVMQTGELQNGVTRVGPPNNPNEVDVYFTVPFANMFWLGDQNSGSMNFNYGGVIKNMNVNYPSGVVTEQD